MSDIHGNAVALRAVLRDAADEGIDEWWVLGDIVALGPSPVEVLEILTSLPVAVKCIAGNTERYVLQGDRPFPSFADVLAEPGLLPRLVEVAVSFAWTRGMVTQAGWFPWLYALPSEIRMTFPDGTRALGVHASPRSDDGAGVDTRISDADLASLICDCGADLVFAGHTHDATDRTLGGVRAINLGSVSNSTRSDRAATYVRLNVDQNGHSIERRVVDYDHSSVASAIDQVAHPAGGYLKRFQTLDP